MGIIDITFKNWLVSDNSHKSFLVCFNNTFPDYTGTTAKNISLLDLVDDGEKVSNGS